MTTWLLTKPASHAQRGAAAIVLVLLVLLGLVTLLTFRLDRRQPELDADKRTSQAIAEAKLALLGEAALDNGGVMVNPGRLLCPDQNNNGQSAGGACAYPTLGASSFVGRVPFRTLGIRDLADQSNERLWYIVDANFRSGSGPINTTTPTSLTLNGQPIVAAVLAAGTPRQNQVRPTNNYVDYVESYNGLSAISIAPPAATNDRIVTITSSELFAIVTFRIARELAAVNVPAYNPALGIGGLSKPQVWIDNNWDGAVDGANSNVAANKITLTFSNCGITYYITGQTTVSRNGSSC